MFQHATTQDEFAKLKESENLLVVKFTAAWCGPCKKMQPKLDTLAAEHKDVVFASVDVDEAEANGWKVDGVESLPTFRFLRDGIQLAEVVGGSDASFAKVVQSISELK